MARQSNKGGTARVRFIMLEAEGPEGDLAQIAQAIHNALRPPQSNQRVLPSVAPNEPAPGIAGATIDADADEVDGAVAEDIGVVPQKTRESRQRRPSFPKAFNFSAEAVASWRAFVGETKPTSEVERYLMVAAWMHEHHNNDPVTPGHVFACYRLADWSTNIPDFGAHLRHAKGQQLLDSAGRGAYTINQLGLQRVRDLRGS